MKGLDKFKTEVQKELDNLKDKNKQTYYKSMTDKILEHMESVCDEEYDNLLNQEHKSFAKMWEFIMKTAYEFAVNGRAFVDDADVYAWCDEYVGLDDKDKVEDPKSTVNTTEQLSIFDLM